MKQILKALNEKLGALRREVKSLNGTVDFYVTIVREKNDHIRELEDKIKSVEASRYRIWEKVCHANKEWRQSAVAAEAAQCQDESEQYKWLFHLKYIAEHAPEGQ